MAQHFISRIDAENELLACAAYLAESIPPGETHASAIAAVVPRYLEIGNVDLAAELSNTVDDPFTRDRLLIAVSSKCAELDDDEYALQLIEAIEDKGFQMQGYEQVAFAKAEKGQIEKAGDIAAMMIHPDGVTARIAICQAAAGNDEGAFSTIGEIEFPRDIVSAFCHIAAQKIRDENFEGAINLLSTSESTAEEIEHDEERIRTYNEIGGLYLEAGEKSRAFQVFEKARADAEELSSSHRDSLLAQVAIGFLNAGSVDAADRTLDAVTDKTQIATVVLAFARDHWRKDEKDEAIEALEEAHAILRSQHENETRDSKAKFTLMGTVAAQFAGFEKCERAIDVADLIPDEAHKSNALSQIAQIATTQGSYAMGDQAASEIESELDRVITTVLMSRAAENAGDGERSTELLQKAAESIPALSEPTMRFNAFTVLLRAQLDSGDQTGANDSFDKAMSALLEVRNSNFKVSGLTELSKLKGEYDLNMSEERLEKLREFLRH